MSNTDAEVKESDLTDKKWIQVQKKTFTNWINDKLKETNYFVEEITKDLGDGVILIILLYTLAPGKRMPRKYTVNPKMDIQKRENLTIALEFLSSVEKFPLVNIGVTDIYQGNLKIILGLIWALIHRYQISGAATTEAIEDSSPTKSMEVKKKKRKVNAKKLLLDWVNASLPLDGITNFTTDWNDGLRLSGLVNYCKPGLIPDHASLNSDNRLQNVSHAMDLAEKELRVPKVLSPEDLAVDKPDELSVMTYISGFCRPDSAGQNSLLEWVNTKIPNHPVSNFTTDWVDGTALAALVDSLSEGGFPESDLMKKDDKYKNCQEAMDAAKSLLGVDSNFPPEDFSENAMDQITLSTYITKFQHAKPLTCEALASQMKAVGPGVTGDSVEKETGFVVRGPRIPNWAKIDTSVKGPYGLEPPVRFQCTSSKAIQFYYTPEMAGDYVVKVNLNRQPIPGSPFNLIHILPSNVDGCIGTGNGLKKARVGETAGFSVDCKQGGPGELQVDIENQNDNLVSEIEKLAEKNYIVNYTPKESGEHFIYVMWNKKNIPSSPFSCVVTDPKQCSINGLTKSCIIQPQSFTVKTDKAGLGELVVEVEGPIGTVDTAIKAVSKNVFNVTYLPKDTGPHLINIRYADDPIPGSPFTVDVVAPADASNCTVSNLPDGRLRVGSTYSIDIDATQAGSGEITAQAHGPTVPESCSIKECGSNLHAVYFTPAEIGILKVDIAYGGDKLPQCPLEFTSNDPTRVKVNSTAIKSGSYLINQPIQFIVSAAHAGEGDLLASVRTIACEEPVELKDQGGKSYLFSYSPSEGGSHAIDIKFDGTEIPDTPLRIFVDDSNLADKVVVSQPIANVMGAYLVETPYNYNVITTGAGHDILEVTSIGSNTGFRPTIKISDDINEQFTVVLTASEPDEYTVNMQWGGKDVPASPFKLLIEGKPQPENVVCVGPVYTVGSCEPVTLEANAEKAGAGKLSATCNGIGVGEILVNVAEHKPRQYHLSFLPPKDDIYTLNVLWLMSDVNDSPFKINLIPPDATKCTVVGPEVPINPTEPILLHVDASEAGNGKIAASVRGDKMGDKDILIVETKPNVFVLSFVPELMDVYTMEVLWDDCFVPGAPFRVSSTSANANKVFICEAPNAMLEAGQTFSVCVDTSEAGKGVLTATCKGENIGKIPITVSQRSITNDKYDLHFLPPVPDIYVVNVLWGGVNAKGSPLTIDLMPVDINMIKVIGPSMPQDPKGPVELMLQAVGARKQKVTGTCEGSSVGTVEVIIKETSTDIFELCFLPPKPDIFNFSVQYGGQKVKDSPFIINTLPSNSSLVKVREPDSIDLSKQLIYNVDTTKAGSGNLTTTCFGENHGPVKLNTTSKVTGYYDVSFIPFADLYLVTVEWDEREVLGSPFKVDLRPPMANRVKVGELHVPVRHGSNKYVWLDLDCMDCGHGHIKAEVKGMVVGKMSVEADQLAKAKYRVKFLPKEADIYTFGVAYGDEQVTGSPFKVNLFLPNASEVKHTRTVLPELKGGTVMMFFNTTNAGSGEMTADVTSELTPLVTQNVEQVSFTEYKLSIVTNVPDIYDVNVKWSGDSVDGSPFKVDTRPPLHAELVECRRPVFTDINDPVNLSLNTFKAGPGKVTAKCTHHDGSKVDTEVVMPTTPSGDHKVFFVPKTHGRYVLSVLFDGEDVKDSPFLVDITPVSELCKQEEFHVIESKHEEGTSGLNFARVNSCTIRVIGKSFDPTNVIVLEEDLPIFDAPVPFGKPACFRISTEDAGPGTLNLTAKGPGKAAVNVSDNKDGTYTCDLTSSIAGKYLIDILWNDNHIKGSPYMLHFKSNEDKVNSGLNLERINSCKVNVIGENPDPTKVVVLEEDLPIFDAPVPFGKPACFRISTEDAGPGTLNLTAKGPGKAAVNVSDNKDGTYTCDLTSSIAGKYLIDILWNDNHIKGSPYMLHFKSNEDKVNSGLNLERVNSCKVNVIGENPDPTKVVVLEEDLPIFDAPMSIGKPACFHISTENAGPGTLNLIAKGPGKATINVSDNKYGTYTCDLTSSIAGKYMIDILWNDNHIKGSPYMLHFKSNEDKVNSGLNLERVNSCKVNVIGENPDPTKVVVLEEDLPIFDAPMSIGKPTCFRISTEDAGPGNLTLTAKGPGKAAVNVSDNKDGTYTCDLTSSIAGKYMIDILWNDNHIKGSPYMLHFKSNEDKVNSGLNLARVNSCKVNVIGENPDPTKVVVLEEDLPIFDAPMSIGKPACFRISTEDAGPGNLTLTAKGPGKAAVNVSDNKDGTYTFDMTSSIAGKYLIDILWNDNHIKGSPYMLHLKSNEDEDNSGLNLERVNSCKVNVIGENPDPTKVVVLEEDLPIFDAPVSIGKPACFHISTENAGPGNVTLTDKGPGKATINVIDNKDGTYTCDLTSSIAGKYMIDILWNDNHIKGSPYMLHFKSNEDKVNSGLNLARVNSCKVNVIGENPDPTKVVVLEEDLPIFDAPMSIGKPACFRISTEDAGPGNLTLTAKGPGKAAVNVSDNKDGTYTFDMTSSIAGKYLIDILWNDNHIKGSPYMLHLKSNEDEDNSGLNLERVNSCKVNVIGENPDPTKVVVLEEDLPIFDAPVSIGKPACFHISTENAGPGNLTLTDKGPGKATINVIDNKDGTYTCDLTSNIAGKYLINIYWNDDHIEGSPYTLHFKQSDAAQCSAEGDGIEACVVDKEANFTVNTSKPSQGALLVTTITGEMTLTPKIKGLGDTKTEVSYIADKAGKYNISIEWDQEEIPDSPFLVECYNPSDPGRFKIEDPPFEVFHHSPLTFTVKSVSGRPKDQYLAVSAQSSQNTFIQGHVEDVEDDDSLYKCTLDLPDIGKYLIYTRWSGCHIRNSPFKVQVITPPRPKKVRAYGPGLENGFIGQEGNFTIEAEDAGTGTLAIKVYGPKRSFKIDMHHHPDNYRTLLVRYDPNQIGKYKVFITLSEVHIPGSPFIIEYTQQ